MLYALNKKKVIKVTLIVSDKVKKSIYLNI